MNLHRFSNDDTLDRTDQALILSFAGRRRVLSTSALSGGIHTDLTHIFNHDCKENGRKNTPLKADTYEEHLRVVARELGLEPSMSSGLTTAASMENAALVTESYQDLTVTAVVTGGIDVNGGRAGDLAQWHEADGQSVSTGGTINVLLHIGAKLTDGALTRALVTCTEAKAAALQELLAPSVYSSGIATGSGTDGVIIITDETSPLLLTYAGKHAKLGELIGRTVLSAVKQALQLETGLDAARQSDIFARIGRYGVTRAQILGAVPQRDSLQLDALATDPRLVVPTSLYVHLLDQLSWRLVDAPDALCAAASLLRDMGMSDNLPPEKDADAAIRSLTNAYTKGLIGLLN